MQATAGFRGYTLKGNYMSKIRNVYYILKEVFGPNISLEIIDITDRYNIKRVIGEEIYETTINREHLNEDELKKILENKTQLNNIPWQLLTIKPGDLLTIAFDSEPNHLIHFEQFSSFNRLIKFTHNQKDYVIIIISPLMEHSENKQLFLNFWEYVIRYLNGERINIIKEYLKSRVPVYMRGNFSIFFELLIKISVQKVENKNLFSGLLVVDKYEEFKQNYYSDLFYNFDCKVTLREIEKIKQPYLEITDGQKNFLIVDKNLELKGIFFPDLQPKGLEIFNYDGKKMLTPSIIAKIEGIDTIRVAANNKMLFEIKNGMVRIRDYSALESIFTNLLNEINISNYHNELLNNVIEISFLHKGTIIIIGNKILPDKYSKGINGEISIISNRNGVSKFRNNILSQLSKTDGAVLIDNNYNVYCFGAILKIENTTTNANEILGGSRSYTAKMFSVANPNHLVIKISEDGPISLFSKGNLKIEV